MTTMTRHLAIRRATFLLALLATAPALRAQGPVNQPRHDGTIKAAAATDLAPVFARQLQLVEERRAIWLAKAEAATPKLLRTPMKPVAVVTVEKDAAAFQGWKTVPAGKPESVLNRPLAPGESFILDFGEHLTGQLILSLRSFAIPVDAPVRLAFVFGEMPAEVAEPFDPYPGKLTRSWLQDEIVMAHLHAYWGGMLKHGADTFWEVHVPGDDRRSPYGSHLMNSYCHAWSCTPTWLLRRNTP